MLKADSVSLWLYTCCYNPVKELIKATLLCKVKFLLGHATEREVWVSLAPCCRALIFLTCSNDGFLPLLFYVSRNVKNKYQQGNWYLWFLFKIIHGFLLCICNACFLSDTTFLLYKQAFLGLSAGLTVQWPVNVEKRSIWNVWPLLKILSLWRQRKNKTRSEDDIRKSLKHSLLIIWCSLLGGSIHWNTLITKI